MRAIDGIALRDCDGGCLLRLRVKPKALRDCVVGIHGDALKIAVKAPPERGKANEAVCAFLATLLGLAGAGVSLSAGDSSQDKTVRIAGIDAAECRRRLSAILDGAA